MVLPQIVFRIPSVEHRMAEWGKSLLASKLNVPVTIRNVSFDFPNRLVFRDVVLPDQQSDTLLVAAHISAKMDLLNMMRKKYILNDLRLINFSLNVKRQSHDSIPNYQFVIDAFSSRDTANPSDIYLNFSSIQLRHGALNYTVADEHKLLGRFDPAHVKVRNLNGQLRLNVFTHDSINCQVERLGFDEQSGFTLNKLALSFVGNRDSATLRNLSVLLPETSLRIDTAGIKFNGWYDDSSLIDSVFLRVKISPSTVCPKDISPFVPALYDFTSVVNLTAEASGYAGDFSIDRLKLAVGQTVEVAGSLYAKNIMRRDEMFVDARIDKVVAASEDIVLITNQFINPDIVLPATLARLGVLTYSGDVSGFVDRLSANGNLRSDVGELDIDLTIGEREKDGRTMPYLSGEITSGELEISKLFNAGNPFGTAGFHALVDMERPQGRQFSGAVDAQIYNMDYRGYRYENILLSGDFNPNEYDGSIEINDPNGRLFAEGFFKSEGANSVFDFAADVQDVRLDELNITKRYEKPSLSMHLNANFTGNNIDLFKGQALVNDLSFSTRTDTFHLDSLRIDSDKSGRLLTVYSDVLNGEISGEYSFYTLTSSLTNTVGAYLPVIRDVTASKAPASGNAFRFAMAIDNTEKLAKALKLPLSIVQTSSISGEYIDSTNFIRLNVTLPRYKIGSSNFEDGSIALANSADKLLLTVKTGQINKRKQHNRYEIASEIADNKIDTKFSLLTAEDKSLDVSFGANTLISSFVADNGKPKLLTEILFVPEKMLVKDTLWTMSPSSITFADGMTTINNFSISRGEQFLRIDGSASARTPANAIKVALNRVELSHIFDIIDIPALQFAGEATGNFTLSNLYETPNINGELEVSDFAFNQVIQGRLNMSGEWDYREEGVMLLGTIYRDSATWTDVSGYIYPSAKTYPDGRKENISLYFDANEIDLNMLHPYFSAFTKTVSGRGVGNIHLFGDFSNLTFEGKALVKDGLIGVDFLNTKYAFGDTIVILPDAITGKNITFRDRDGNTGTISFEVKHKYLKDFSFHSDIQVQKVLLYDVPERINPVIYGTVYGSGNGRIAWVNDNLVTIDANIRNDAGSFMGFNFMNSSSAEDYDFIYFAQPTAAGTQTAVEQRNTAGDETEIRVNCFLDVTPEGSLELVMDPVSGDKIKGNGSGDIQVRYDTNSDISMFGGFTVASGSYNFSLQQVLHKDFKIRDGSRIDFSGNPLDAILNLNASYYMTASIEDLDQALLKETFRTSVPVNCILNLNGRLQNPAISFDLEFPNSTNELQRQVKSFIGTEDMMARQIVYLLVLNKFYTPDYSRNDYRQNEFSAVASSALSAQLSSILNSLTDKVQIGTNIRSRQDGVSDTEVEMLLSSQLLDNRLLFNGNFGYKNNFIQTNAFIGEFDLEYKLTPDGVFRLKAYNHANDMYRYNMKSLTRQGVGLMYHKDFDTLGDIFRRRKTTLTETENPSAPEAETSEN